MTCEAHLRLELQLMERRREQKDGRWERRRQLAATRAHMARVWGSWREVNLWMREDPRGMIGDFGI